MNRTFDVHLRFAAARLIGLSALAMFTGPAAGNTAFAPAVPYPVGTVPIGATVADVEGDDALDVIVANSQSGDLSVLVNNGDGTLAPEVRLGAGGGMPRHVAVGDLDGDGDADLVVAMRDGPGTIAVFLAESAGVFAPAVQYGAPTVSFALAMTDLDSDGDLDVAVIVGVAVSVFRNAGDGTFVSAGAHTVFEAPIVYTADLAAADVNGDGRIDLIVVNDCPVGCDASIAVLINAGDGTFGPPIPLDLGIASAGAVRAGDLDGDGDADLALVDCNFPGSDLVIAVNDGAGGFSVLSRSATDRDCAGGSVTTPEGLAILDADGDGAPDVVLTSRLDDGVRVLRNRGDLTFEPALAFGAGDRPIAVATGDLDGDGRPDVVTVDMAIGGAPTATVLINRTPGVCAADLDGSGDVGFSDLLAVLSAWGNGGSEDLDGSGVVDFVDLLIVLAAWGSCS